MIAQCLYNDYFDSSCSDDPIVIRVTPSNHCSIKSSIDLPDDYGPPLILFSSCLRYPCTEREKGLPEILTPFDNGSLLMINKSLNSSYSYFELEAGGFGCLDEACKLSFNYTDICNRNKTTDLALQASSKQSSADSLESLILVPLLISILVLLLILVKKRNYFFNCINRCRLQKTKKDIVNEHYTQPSESVFIAYGNDHPLHEDVVVKLATFLEAELGLHVILDLYNKQDIYINPVIWLEKALSADRIMILWSPKVAQTWNNSRSPEDNLDMLSPVLEKFKRNLVFNHDLSKYIMITFSYFDETPLPSVGREVSCFKMVKEIDICMARLQNKSFSKMKNCPCLFKDTNNESGYKKSFINSVQTMSKFSKQNFS